jgi:2,4-dienoyl-CoA reductase-like NADH-dependent reductase (Old Yellow Enzyme family)
MSDPFSPVQLGPVTLRNRTIKAATSEGRSPDGLGGITNRDHLETAMREGFDFMAMGRALLREPDLVNKMTADRATRSRCTHNNKCMVTVFGRTHCVLDPEQGQAKSADQVSYAARTSVSEH